MFSTEQGRFELRRAEAVHAGEMLALLTEAAEVMEQQGRKQWSPSLFSLELMEQYLEEREVFILWHEDKAAGMFTLQYGDPDYWGKRDDPSYGYLHRLTVRFAYRGLELGKQNDFLCGIVFGFQRETGLPIGLRIPFANAESILPASRISIRGRAGYGRSHREFI